MPAPKDPVKAAKWIENIRQSRLGTHASQSTKDLMSEQRQGEKHPLYGIPRSDETKQLLRDANLGKVQSEESSIKKGIANTERYKDPAERKRTSEANIKFYQEHPLFLKGVQERLRKQWEDDNANLELRLKIRETKIGGFWYGNVRYYTGQITCVVWKDVNPRVHAFFDYKCVECGKFEDKASFAGHHVFYERQACCMTSEDGDYYTNLNASNHLKRDYFIGKNPNYFVILCPECHGKTNGGFKNRKKWADHFRKLIDDNYGRKSYFTKEEWKIIKSDLNSQSNHSE